MDANCANKVASLGTRRSRLPVLHRTSYISQRIHLRDECLQCFGACIEYCHCCLLLRWICFSGFTDGWLSAVSPVGVLRQKKQRLRMTASCLGKKQVRSRVEFRSCPKATRSPWQGLMIRRRLRRSVLQQRPPNISLRIMPPT